MDETGRPGAPRPRVLVVGAGFVGFRALRVLERRLPAGAADLVVVDPADHFLYTPLLPDVAAGAVEPRHITVPLRQALPRTRAVLGRVTGIDLDARTATVDLVDDTGGATGTQVERWDHLVLAPGSVTRRFDLPGVAEHARGAKSLREALSLRDHLITQLDAADALAGGPASDAERAERLTVVAVGAGYTGTEVVARLQARLEAIASRWRRLRPDHVRWVLVDHSTAVLPELGPRLGRRALSVLRGRGIDVRLGVSVVSATDRSVVLDDGSVVPTRTLVWGAGVTANPLVSTLGLPLAKGRLVVDAQLRVPGHDGVWAAGDAAAVPDLARAARHGDPPVTPPTAQHAQRQGTAIARNVAAALGRGRARPYRHRDLGLVADLGGRDAVARPLGVPLSGAAAKVITRGYHVYAMPSAANRVRISVDWLLAAALPDQAVQLSAGVPAIDPAPAAPPTGAAAGSVGRERPGPPPAGVAPPLSGPLARG